MRPTTPSPSLPKLYTAAALLSSTTQAEPFCLNSKTHKMEPDTQISVQKNAF